MAPAPHASHQVEHDWAIALADEIIAEAASRNVRVALAIVDHRGDPIQQDVMDGAATAGAFVSLAVAATAATFQLASAQLAGRYSSIPELAGTLPYPILGSAGGIPISEGSAFVGGLGVAGVEPALAEEIAVASLARMS
jgi:glc operon protein GlcG